MFVQGTAVVPSPFTTRSMAGRAHADGTHPHKQRPLPISSQQAPISNATDKSGATPLHRAVRTRCSAAVKALLERGADPRRKNNSGSTPMLLATQNTGRGGSGSSEAKAQQELIVQLLREHLDRQI